MSIYNVRLCVKNLNGVTANYNSCTQSRGRSPHYWVKNEDDRRTQNVPQNVKEQDWVQPGLQPLLLVCCIVGGVASFPKIFFVCHIGKFFFIFFGSNCYKN